MKLFVYRCLKNILRKEVFLEKEFFQKLEAFTHENIWLKLNMIVWTISRTFYTISFNYMYVSFVIKHLKFFFFFLACQQYQKLMCKKFQFGGKQAIIGGILTAPKEYPHMVRKLFSLLQ